MESKTQRLLFMISLLFLSSSRPGFAQLTAPPLTPDQLQRLHMVKAWEIDYTYEYYHNSKGSGDLTESPCSEGISTWNFSEAYQLNYHVTMTTAGEHGQSDCGLYSDSCIAKYPARVDQFVETHQIHEYMNVLNANNTIYNSVDKSEQCSGSGALDGMPGRAIAGRFRIDYSANPPVAVVAFNMPIWTGAVETTIEVDHFANDPPGYTHSDTSTSNPSLYVNAEPYNPGDFSGGDTQIREDNKGFVIQDNVITTNTTRGSIVPCADSNAAIFGNYSATVSWTIRAHPDSSIVVTRPHQDELWISGTTDTISWYSADTEAVNIFYSTDSGRSYQPIAEGLSAGAAQNYVWTVPKNILSRKSRIRVESATDTVNYGESALFRMKGYVLTRVNANGDYEAFRPGIHDWNFPNDSAHIWPAAWYTQFDYADSLDPYTGENYPLGWPFLPYYARDWNFPDWPLLVHTFGTAECYIAPSIVTGVYRPSAVLVWRHIAHAWGGSCFGFAVSSLMAFDNPGQFMSDYPAVGFFSNLSFVGLTNQVRLVINALFLSQFGEAFSAYRSAHLSDRPNDVLAALKDMFRSESRDDRFIYFCDRGGHAVVPYRIDTSPINPIASLVYVYDNNFPGDSTAALTVNTQDDDWVYPRLGWFGQYNFSLSPPVSSFRTPPALPKGANTQPAIAAGTSAYLPVKVYAASASVFTLTDSAGNSCGYRDTAFTSTIGGAEPVFPISGYPHPPLYYLVPSGSYTISASHFADSVCSIGVFSDSVDYEFERAGALYGQTDRIRFGAGLSACNPDSAMKSVTLSAIRIESQAERVLTLLGLGLGKSDSIHMQFRSDRSIDLQNTGAPTTYRIQLSTASQDGATLFDHADVSLPQNSAHRIIPAWDNLEFQPVKILISSRNNGTFDDSVLIQNQVTSVPGREVESGPLRYMLVPNYPNPFNPSTVIAYQIPERQRVTVAVFNILGQRVASLVDEVENAGTYRVTWTPGGTAASGVYFCRMSAGAFVATRKMVLVR